MTFARVLSRTEKVPRGTQALGHVILCVSICAMCVCSCLCLCLCLCVCACGCARNNALAKGDEVIHATVDGRNLAPVSTCLTLSSSRTLFNIVIAMPCEEGCRVTEILHQLYGPLQLTSHNIKKGARGNAYLRYLRWCKISSINRMSSLISIILGLS